MGLRAAYAYFRRRSNASLEAHGATSDQFVLLTVLAGLGEATQQELVRECHSDTTTVGTMTVLMEERGWVARTAHEGDGRAWRVRLTPQGRALQRRLWKASDGVRQELEGCLDANERALLAQFLERILQVMRPEPARVPRVPAGRERIRPAGRSRRGATALTSKPSKPRS